MNDTEIVDALRDLFYVDSEGNVVWGLEGDFPVYGFNKKLGKALKERFKFT